MGGLGPLAPPAGGVPGAVGGGAVSQRWGTAGGFAPPGGAELALALLPRRRRPTDEET